MAKSLVSEPKSLVEAIRYFSDGDRAFAFVCKLRWPDGNIVCPRCDSGAVGFIATRRMWKCKNCKRQFSLKVGTIFEDSPIGWDKWLPAVWLIANSKNSVSSHELARSLGVTQKTAWFMFHRIRLAMETKTFQKLTGTVEVDETYIGGDAKNMHKWVRQAKVRRPHNDAKVPVQGARSRTSGEVRADVLRAPLRHNVDRWVEMGSTCQRSRYPAALRSSNPPLGPWEFCLLHGGSRRPLASVDELSDLAGEVVGRWAAEFAGDGHLLCATP